MLTSSFVFSAGGRGEIVQPDRGGEEAARLLLEVWGGEEKKRVSFIEKPGLRSPSSKSQCIDSQHAGRSVSIRSGFAWPPRLFSGIYYGIQAKLLEK